MNPKPIPETEAIRSDIEMTRRRMDETINALGERVQGRHLLDEAIGFFRHNSDTASAKASQVRDKLSATAGKVSDQLSDAAGTATHAVIDTVKNNPLPILMITAGAAWLAYSATRGRKADVEEDLEDSDRYDPDTHYDRPLDYTGGMTTEGADTSESSGSGDMTDEASSKFAQLKDKAGEATDQMKEKFSQFSDAARDKLQSAKERASEFGSHVRDRASELGSQVQDRTREMYAKSRDRVKETADTHPLEVGLGCLAVGVLIGLAIPTPEPVNRFAGPTVDRLRNRTKDAGRDMLEKGKRVVRAATSAAKQEAESQGLSLDRLSQSGEAVAERAGEAAEDTAHEEGLTSGSSENERAGADPADPSAARPAM